jgi:hypothetical protein
MSVWKLYIRYIADDEDLKKEQEITNAALKMLLKNAKKIRDLNAKIKPVKLTTAMVTNPKIKAKLIEKGITTNPTLVANNQVVLGAEDILNYINELSRHTQDDPESWMKHVIHQRGDETRSDEAMDGSDTKNRAAEQMSIRANRASKSSKQSEIRASSTQQESSAQEESPMTGQGTRQQNVADFGGDQDDMLMMAHFANLQETQV